MVYSNRDFAYKTLLANYKYLKNGATTENIHKN